MRFLALAVLLFFASGGFALAQLMPEPVGPTAPPGIVTVPAAAAHTVPVKAMSFTINAPVARVVPVAGMTFTIATPAPLHIVPPITIPKG